MPELIVRRLGRVEYLPTWRRMRDFTLSRTEHAPGELWLVEHPPVFTLGQAGKCEHLRNPGDIPVVRTDRGGQVTYHGPGQLLAYVLIDLRETGIGARALVSALENSVIDLLADQDITAVARPDAPGVYVDDAKVAALGLRIKKGCSYHGLALNLDMDLTPYQRINPCGHPGMSITQLRDLGIDLGFDETASRLVEKLATRLGYTIGKITTETP